MEDLCRCPEGSFFCATIVQYTPNLQVRQSFVCVYSEIHQVLLSGWQRCQLQWWCWQGHKTGQDLWEGGSWCPEDLIFTIDFNKYHVCLLTVQANGYHLFHLSFLYVAHLFLSYLLRLSLSIALQHSRAQQRAWGFATVVGATLNLNQMFQTQVERATRCETQMSGDRAVVECRDYCEQSGCNTGVRGRGASLGLTLGLASLYLVLYNTWDISREIWRELPILKCSASEISLLLEIQISWKV